MVGCLGKVALAAVMVEVCWECMVGELAAHLLDPLQNRFGQILVFRLYCLGHENSALSLSVSTESDPGGHGLSHPEPGVNIWKLVGVPRVSFYDLINRSDLGQI
jgi:hypothetical protein